MKSKNQINKEIEEKEAQIKMLRKQLEFLENKERASRSSDYRTRKRLLEQAAPIFASYVKLGDFVRVIGAKSGPIRKVKEINEHYVVGSACNKSRNDSITIDEYDIRKCRTDKITSWLFGGRWITAKEVLENRELYKKVIPEENL